MITANGLQEREEVFYTIPLQSRRRHSIGGYLTAGGLVGGGEVTTVPSEVPRMPAPKLCQKTTEEEVAKRRRPKNIPIKGNYSFINTFPCLSLGSE